MMFIVKDQFVRCNLFPPKYHETVLAKRLINFLTQRNNREAEGAVTTSFPCYLGGRQALYRFALKKLTAAGAFFSIPMQILKNYI
jgi:hypothetical protein